MLTNFSPDKMKNHENIGAPSEIFRGIDIHRWARSDPQGGRGRGVGVKIDFRKTSFLSVSRRNFFRKFQGGSPRVKNG